MAGIGVFEAGGYRYIEGAFQYSGGVAAQPGFELERVRLRRPLPLAQGFAAVERHLAARGRPVTAFAACELRTPAPFSEQGFYEFNKAYVITLERWGIYRGGERPVNPVARTNVCPMYAPPAEAMLYAFSYTVPSPAGAPGTFMLSGAGESTGAGATHRERVVRPDDTSPEGMRAKVEAVLAEMQRRLHLLGFSWSDATATQVYTIQNIGHLAGEVLAAAGACAGGLVWTYARPPIAGLEFEMDVHGIARESMV